MQKFHSDHAAIRLFTFINYTKNPLAQLVLERLCNFLSSEYLHLLGTRDPYCSNSSFNVFLSTIIPSQLQEKQQCSCKKQSSTKRTYNFSTAQVSSTNNLEMNQDQKKHKAPTIPLRKFTPSDVDAFMSWVADPRVTCCQCRDPYTNQARALAYIITHILPTRDTVPSALITNRSDQSRQRPAQSFDRLSNSIELLGQRNCI